ncbi:MAG: amino acid ABC transporter permease [Desulfatitalea sp. BRH_c12]|nr:MAG: amino acid ABC transporter permease [Desulfatitalea sp. BRH_c12]
MSTAQNHTDGPEISQEVPFWHDPGKRAIVFQALILCLVFAAGYYIFANTQANLRRQAISTGFGFLGREAGFGIGEALIPYSAANSYAHALLVGLLNTLNVAFIGILLTLLLGVVIGIARLSSNWLVSKLATGYIEVLQNIPVLLQLFFWYSLFNDLLPSPRQSFSPLPGVFFSNRGFYFPVPVGHCAFGWAAAAFGGAALVCFLLRRWARKRQDQTGQIFPFWPVSAVLLVGFPLLAWSLAGAPTAMSIPHLTGFNFQGGFSLSPEFGALLIGLVLYTSAFVAEIVRAGIQAISIGQSEAAMSLGLKSNLVLSLIILPQAMRIIIPPLTSQMLNLTKNSSLAVAIGYPDFVSVANTTINQTGQAIEGVLIIMVVYLILSLLTSAFMNWYNKNKALVER